MPARSELHLLQVIISWGTKGRNLRSRNEARDAVSFWWMWLLPVQDRVWSAMPFSILHKPEPHARCCSCSDLVGSFRMSG